MLFRSTKHDRKASQNQDYLLDGVFLFPYPYFAIFLRPIPDSLYRLQDVNFPAVPSDHERRNASPASMEYHMFRILLCKLMPEGFDEFLDYLRHPASMETIINTDSRLGQYDSLRGKFAS